MYAKVFTSIFDSTINEQPPHVFKVWIALLAFAQDGDGIVDMTSKAIANRTELPLEVVEDAIGILSSPDPSSRCQDYEGRRIIPIPDRPYGWQIVTFKHYRDIKRASDRREYMRDYMRGRRRHSDEPIEPPVSTCKQPVSTSKQTLGVLADTASASASTSETKEKPTPAESNRKPPAKDLVEGLSLTDELRSLASSLSLNAEAELEQFRDRMRSNGYRTNAGPVRDATAAFRTHLRNAAKFSRTAQPIKAGGTNADQFRTHFGNR